MQSLANSRRRSHSTAGVRIAAAVLFAGSCIAAGHARSLIAQTPDLPAARDLIARHVAAIGGESAFQAIKSIRQRGTIENVGQNLSGEFETLQARPAKLVQHLTITGFGQLMEGFDGKIGWLIDPQSGPSLLTDRALTEIAQDALFDAPLHPVSQYTEATTVERTQFDRRPAFKVKVVFTSGLEELEYFDAETGLEIGWEGSRATPNGVLPTSEKFREYKKFGEILWPSVVILRQLGSDQTLTMTSCVYNDVPANAFDLPKPVKALVK